LTVSDDDACAIQGTVEEEAIAWGADVVYLFENERFSTPTAHLFADALTAGIQEKSPRLVLFPLTDFGRDLAARTRQPHGPD
jgi:electron transfer flavoprotein alpha subunit